MQVAEKIEEHIDLMQLQSKKGRKEGLRMTLSVTPGYNAGC